MIVFSQWLPDKVRLFSGLILRHKICIDICSMSPYTSDTLDIEIQNRSPTENVKH